jgi:hypothetical protein
VISSCTMACASLLPRAPTMTVSTRPTLPDTVPRLPELARYDGAPTQPARFPPMTPDAFRSMFPALDHTVWLDTPATAPGAIPVMDAVAEALEQWRTGQRRWSAWWQETRQQCRSLIAAYLGVQDSPGTGRAALPAPGRGVPRRSPGCWRRPGWRWDQPHRGRPGCRCPVAAGPAGIGRDPRGGPGRPAAGRLPLLQRRQRRRGDPAHAPGRTIST